MRTFRTMLCALAVGGCAHFPVAEPSVQNNWDRTLDYARRDVEAGNYFAADRLLDEYVRLDPDSREAKEIAFWKAVYTLDPANERGSLTRGIAALDQYLASGDSTAWYRNEALVLRRTAAAAQGVTVGAGTPSVAASSSAASSAASSSAPGKDTAVVVTTTKDEEIASLKDQLAKSKDELAKVSAELDRIKKRLANPSK
jgi:hypothetical protein